MVFKSQAIFFHFCDKDDTEKKKSLLKALTFLPPLGSHFNGLSKASQ